MYKDHHAAL